MITLPTPIVLAIGRREGKLSAYDIEGGRYYDLPVDLSGIGVAELKASNDEVRSHVAVASYSTSLVKAIAVDGNAELLDSNGIRELSRGKVTLRAVMNKEFGRWDDVWNKPILIRGGTGALALGISRAGSLLHLNAARTDESHIRAVVDALNALRNFGEVSSTCSCRLGLFPVEVVARRSTEYILAKIYMNIQIKRSSTVIVIRGSGGNILKRYIGPLERLNFYIDEAQRE